MTEPYFFMVCCICDQDSYDGGAFVARGPAIRRASDHFVTTGHAVKVLKVTDHGTSDLGVWVTTNV